MQLGTVQQLPSVNGSAPLARGLRAWYMTPGQAPGKGLLQDISPARNHGRLVNSATSFAGMPSASSSFLATDYDGTSGAAVVQSTAQNTNIFSGGGMFAAWVYMDSYTIQPRLFDKNQTYAAFTSNNAGKLSLSIFQWFGGNIGIFASASPNQYPVPIGAWTHVALVYDSSSASNVGAIYINGSAIAVSVSSTPSGVVVDDSPDTLNIGNSGGFSRSFDGRMFDIRFYKGFLPDANFVRSVYLDAANGFAGTLATSRRHRQKKGAAGSSLISGTSAITLTGSATVTGRGTLAGIGTVTFTQAGTLTGRGALAGTSTATITATGTATGRGALAATGTLTVTGSATVTGSGALAGTSTASITGSAGLTGRGALVGTTTAAITGSATASGLGALAGSGTVTVTQSGTLTGLGGLAGTAAAQITGSATLGGLGSLGGSGAFSIIAAGSLSGVVYATGSATLSITATGTLTSFAILFCSPEHTLFGTSSFCTLSSSGVIGALFASQTTADINGTASKAELRGPINDN